MKVDDLTGAKLDYWVARATGREMAIRSTGLVVRFLEGAPTDWRSFCPSSDWSCGGPIIEHEKIELFHQPGAPERCRWSARSAETGIVYIKDGRTPLVAAMRAYIASKFGESVEDLPA
jgi:hypothetical protein